MKINYDEVKNVYGFEVAERDMVNINPALRMVAVPVNELKLDENNARKHGKRSIDAIAESLRQFGQQKAIVFDKDNVIRAGNGTYEAAIKLGWGYVAAIPTSLEDAKVTAWAIADNRTTELSSWDEEALKNIFVGLKEEESDLLGATGFAGNEIDILFSGDADIVKEQDEELYKIELRPYESYDYMVVLSDNLHDWNWLCEFFGLRKVNAAIVEGQKKIGVGRGVRASELIKKIQEYSGKNV